MEGKPSGWQPIIGVVGKRSVKVNKTLKCLQKIF